MKAILCERLQQPATANFREALLLDALGKLTATALPTVIPLFPRFNGNFVVDCTNLSLPAVLAQKYAGCGGGTGTNDPLAVAAVKVMVQMDLGIGRTTQPILKSSRTLVFKRWKSLGGLDIRKDLSAGRAECELYGQLLGVLMVDWFALTRGRPAIRPIAVAVVASSERCTPTHRTGPDR
jgi:hypothetical protein